MQKRYYTDYDEYIKFQSEKTLNPEKRKKWLGEEWDLKLDGFKNEFAKLSNYLDKDMKCLCIGARTGQEVLALKELGIENVVGIDIVPHDPYVIIGDMHNLDYDDDYFDFVYTNIIDHSIYPAKAIGEIERVLKNNGIFFLQMQIGIDQDTYTEFVIKNPFHDVCVLFEQSYCVHISGIERNFAGMNFEMIFQKDQTLSKIFKTYGRLDKLEIPATYEKIWEDINLPIQTKKLNTSDIVSNKKRNVILSGLKKRAYYLTRIAKEHGIRDIIEVGTAEGWQFYSFCEYARKEMKEGSVTSCDPRDVRSKKYIEEYADDKKVKYIQGTSNDITNDIKAQMIFIDGLHDANMVSLDVYNLQGNQDDSNNVAPVWVFDDFDVRFGCYEDIARICQFSRRFKVYRIGLTASGEPSHQVLVRGKFNVTEN